MEKSLLFINPFFSKRGINTFLQEFGFTVLVMFIKCFFFFYLIILAIFFIIFSLNFFENVPFFKFGFVKIKNFKFLFLLFF